MGTEHIGIAKENFEEFVNELNKVSANNNVFATQTHVKDKMFYAICFVRV
jgi:hypothetical protein